MYHYTSNGHRERRDALQTTQITCLPMRSSTTLSHTFLARVNFRLSSSSMVWYAPIWWTEGTGSAHRHDRADRQVDRQNGQTDRQTDLDILVLLQVGSLHSELTGLGVEVDGLHTHGEGGPDPGAAHAARGRLRLHLPGGTHRRCHLVSTLVTLQLTPKHPLQLLTIIITTKIIMLSPPPPQH